MALPERSRVVVVGGGIVGCSTAYHLTKLGVSDVLVLERHQLTSGTTWHAAGLVAQLRSTENQTRLARYSHELYMHLEEETGQPTGFRSPGAVSVAATQPRWDELRRNADMARRLGIDAFEIGPREIREKFPLAAVDDLVGGIWLPDDSAVAPTDCTMALAKGARMGGATIIERVDIADLWVRDGRCLGVITAAGERIEAETVVLACGLWTRQLAAAAGVSVPLMAAEHHYVVTQPLPGAGTADPVLRDPDRCAYFKPEAGGSLLVGLFESEARPWPPMGQPPTHSPFLSIDPDVEHIGAWLEPALKRVPALADAGLRLIFTGPESFTPDDAYILGETPSIEGLFVAAGFNSIGIQSAGGVGMALASWIVDQRPPMDLVDVDIRRFEHFQATEPYLRKRTVETPGLLYAPHWPHRQPRTARGIRRSPLHDRLSQAGACFGELKGWERPMFFARPDLGIEATWVDSWDRPDWHRASAAEHLAVRQQVGLFDQSSSGKFCVQGRDAAAVLNWLSTADVAGEVGRSVHTQWCNPKGGIEADLTVSRIAEDEFWVIGDAATRIRDLTTIRRAIADFRLNGAAATVADITSAYACLTVAGPNSRELLADLTHADLSNDSFPHGCHREINVGASLARANRMSYVGELGWELYVPTEFAPYVYDELVEAGGGHGLVLCGFLAMDSLRLEVGNPHWGADVGPDDTPVQAGLSRYVGWKKADDFVGRPVLEAQRVEGVERALVQIAVDDAQVSLHRNETVWCGERVVGNVTSGMWGHSVGAAVAMGWVDREQAITPEWIRGSTWQVEVAGVCHRARVQLEPWLDPCAATGWTGHEAGETLVALPMGDVR